MLFDLPKDEPSIIKIIGVGGGGSNAVTHMYKQGIVGVDYAICNTDAQAMHLSAVPTKIALGATLTEGRGAGSTMYNCLGSGAASNSFLLIWGGTTVSAVP